MNTNRITTGAFSNPASAALYENGWPDEPALLRQCRENALQCGGCTWYAPFDADWGLCCAPVGRHRLETVFEHFTCPTFLDEGWGPHSFSTHIRCTCRGVDRDEIDETDSANSPIQP